MATLLTLSSSRHALPSSSRQHSHPSVASPPVKRSNLPSSPRTDTRSRSRQSQREPKASESMKDRPVTPTPKKGPRQPRRGGQQRRNQEPGNAVEDSPDLDVSTEDEALFDLLGVPSASSTTLNESNNSTPGILAISKADLASDKPRTRSRNKKNTSPEQASRTNQDGTSAEADGEPKKRGAKSKKTKAKQDDTTAQPISNLSATRPKTSKAPKPAAQPGKHGSPFETDSLSRSLPTDGVFASAHSKSKGKKDESAVWEMPEQQGNDALTWQQKLVSGSTDSPRRSNKSTPGSNGDRKPRSRPGSQANQAGSASNSSPLVPRPKHGRTVSQDGLPHSTFDITQPFHTGFNVNRAPQTPAKLPTSMAPGASLPIIPGEFPRIGKSSHVGSAGTPAGIKYAGPTFHNSPHAASLPKPDLEDF